MARTRCGDCASSSLKVSWPVASVLERPASSMPWLSLRRTTSSPAAGLPVVEFLTVPVRVWEKAREQRRRTIARAAAGVENTFLRAARANTLERRENSLRVRGRVPADKGSFDCVSASLREALTSLRMTVWGAFKIGVLFAARGFRGEEYRQGLSRLPPEGKISGIPNRRR